MLTRLPHPLRALFRRLRRTEGQAAVFLVLMVFLFGAMGAAVIDVGFLLNARRDAQGAADNAALAGTLEISLSSSPAIQAADEVAALNQATAWAEKNGVAATPSELTVTPVRDCFSGTGHDDGLTTGVRVSVDRQPSSFFLGVLNIANWTVHATGVACSSGRDVAVTIDRSGSMCADTLGYVSSTCPSRPAPWEPFDSVQRGAIAFERQFSPTYDQMSLVSYSSTATTDQSLGRAFGIGSAYETAVNAMAPGGSTNISAALGLARTQLTSAAARSGAAKIIVLLTDGIPNLPTNTTVGRSEALAEAQHSADAGIRIYVIGLGHDLDAAFLQQIASTGSGVYLNAPAASDLQSAFDTIADLAHARLAR